MKVLDGRYGPYVTDGKTNATLPRGTDPTEVSVERSLELLDAKRKAPKKGRRKAAPKSGAKGAKAGSRSGGRKKASARKG